VLKLVAIALLVLACKDERPAARTVTIVVDAAPDAPAIDDSPEALARAFLGALASSDPVRVRALYMTPEHVTALVTCEKDPVMELREHLTEVEKQLGPASSEVKFRRWQEDGRSVQKAGTVERGCTAKRDFELALGSVHFAVTTQKGTTTLDSKILAVVRIGDRWRVWKMSQL
jgi:hypothetical protein